MDSILGEQEQRLKNRILERHKSVRAFAMSLNLPCSTVNNVLRRGVMSVNLSTAAVLCNSLGLDIAAFVDGRVTPTVLGVGEPWESELLEDCRRLDTHGRQLVSMVAKKELERCGEHLAVYPAKVLPKSSSGWQQYVGMPIACRGGGITTATEQDAKRMDKIYRKLMADSKQGTVAERGEEDDKDV